MRIDLRHRPDHTVARLTLEPGQSVRAESGALMAMSSEVVVTTHTDGGLMKGLKRSVLGGESLFVAEVTAGKSGGWVDLAPSLPGDVVELGVDGALTLARGAWMCSVESVRIDTTWTGMTNLLGGHGGFLVRASGAGTVLVSVYGAVDVVELDVDEILLLDPGHLLAFEDGLNCVTRDIAASLGQSLKSSENILFEFTGPGRLWTQTRSPRDLTRWLKPKVRK